MTSHFVLVNEDVKRHTFILKSFIMSDAVELVFFFLPAEADGNVLMMERYFVF